METSWSGPPENPLSTRGDIIRWWEARRYTFNAFLLAVGFGCWLLIMTAGSAAVKPGEDFEEPMAMLSGTVIYVVMANIFYTLGWVVETVFYNGRPRNRLYRSGLIFTGVPHRGARSLGCGRVAHNSVHRART